MTERRQSPAKAGAFLTIIVLCIALVAVLVVNKLSITLTGRSYPTEVEALTPDAGAASSARGAHLVRAVLGCGECHGTDLGGGTVLKERFVGSVSALDLTGETFSDADFVRAVRHGVNREGRGLWLMPTAAYAALSDTDLAAVIAYVRSLPRANRQYPRPRLGLWGRVLVATGRLNLIQAGAPRPDAPPPASGTGVAYGAYLAQIARCESCHGKRLRGIQAAPDLTPQSLDTWHATDFVRALRDGKRPDGSALDANAMPWRTYSGMTDEELRALWAYLQSQT